MEAFQVVGGAFSCVDLALKLYKELERFRLRVRQADEVGQEMAAKCGRLTKTLDDIHSALKRRRQQLGDHTPNDDELRIWVNIKDSLKGMQLSLRWFKGELEILDKGRDVTVKRKWIDRAIWQLQLNKKQPVFERLEEAANTRRDELSLSLLSLQILLHSEHSQDIKALTELCKRIEVQLRQASVSQLRSPVVGEFRTALYRRPNRRQLMVCLRAAHAIVGEPESATSTRHSNKSRTDSITQDDQSIWETDAESIFERAAASQSRRATLQVAPDVVPDESATSDAGPASPLFDDYGDDSSDEDYTDYSNSSGTDDGSLDTSITNDATNGSAPDIHESFYTPQNSLEPATPLSRTARNDSVSSDKSTISYRNVDSNTARELVKAINEKDVASIDRIRSSFSAPDSRRPSVTVSKLPPLHYAIKLDAGPNVIDSLASLALVDVNASEPAEQLTALHYAVKYNRESYLSHLLSAPGVNLEAEDKYHRTPLAYALNLSSQQDADVYAIAKKLLDAGAKIPSQLPKGMSRMVEELVKKHQKSRRMSAGTTASRRSVSGESVITKARTNIEEESSRRLRRKWTSVIQRSASART